MIDKRKLMSDLEGLTFDDWHMFHCDTDVQGIAINALEVLEKQPEIVRCKDCEYWVPGVITDQDDFIPPKCGKYSQMVGHSADDFCSLGKKAVKQE